jgi:hypothetical protein
MDDSGNVRTEHSVPNAPFNDVGNFGDEDPSADDEPSLAKDGMWIGVPPPKARPTYVSHDRGHQNGLYRCR